MRHERGCDMAVLRVATHRFHYKSMEHQNGLLHCSARTRRTQNLVGGDVPMFWQNGNGDMERFHFAWLRAA